jgi:hypothetical protein
MPSSNSSWRYRRGEVVTGRNAPVLAGDDVVNLERNGIELLRDATIFTSVPRAAPDFTHQRLFHETLLGATAPF